MSDKPKPKLRVVGKEPVEHQTPDDPKPVNTDVIAELERLLADAKAGDLIGFAAVLQMPDEYMAMDFAGEAISYQMIGGLEELKADILEELRDQDE